MSIGIFRFATVGLVVTVAACTPPPPPPAPVAPAVSYDGHYSGTIQMRGQSAAARGTDWCNIPRGMSVTVSNNNFTYVLHPNLAQAPTMPFDAAVGPDGSFSTVTPNGDASLMGRITDTTVNGTIAGTFCSYAFALSRN